MNRTASRTPWLSILAASLALVTGALVACSGEVTDEPLPTTTTTTTTTTGSGGTGGLGGTGGAGGQGTGGIGTGGTGGVPVAGGKVDLLLVVDNSRGIGEKQALLASSLPELLGVFVNPRCVDADGAPVATQPATASDPCPGASTRELQTITDLHVGVISTSIGGHGSDACVGDTTPSENDAAHLLDRVDPSGGGSVPTYQSLGFLAWDPLGSLTPPGESSATALATALRDIVLGVGQVGCGFEAQLESWYRFLVDPNPYASIAITGGSAVLQGTDQALLDQRAEFLRPDSVVTIVLLSDENDCSTRDGGQYFYANQIYQGVTQFHLPRPRSECATDPNDPCCLSCGQAAGNCAPDPVCNTGVLPAIDDAINLRCFDQKRRFGIDFLWPIDRYVAGLGSATVADRDGNLVPNPLFVGGRPAGWVYYVGIVGVPWQDIARKAGNTPDLLAGLDANGHAVGGLQSPSELVQNGVWDVILGQPATYVPPTDPLMRESIDPRTGTNPVTGDALMPPGSGLLANPINGHEYSIPGRNDLQYACVYPLAQPKNCGNPGQVACDCQAPNNDNPVCQAPNGQFGQTQYYTKAYPGRRELTLLRALGSRGVVGSACAAQIATASARDYAFRPAIAAMAEALRAPLAP